jgi:hypothetical protein
MALADLTRLTNDPVDGLCGSVVEEVNRQEESLNFGLGDFT